MAKKEYKVEKIPMDITDLSDFETKITAIGNYEWVLIQATPLISDPDDENNWLCIFQRDFAL